jgi:hypothetical protein
MATIKREFAESKTAGNNVDLGGRAVQDRQGDGRRSNHHSHGVALGAGVLHLVQVQGSKV